LEPWRGTPGEAMARPVAEDLRPVYSRDKIGEAVRRIGDAINRDYAGMDILFLGVLKGSFVFLADLVREVRVPCAVDFVRLSSYGSGTRSSQAVRLAMPWQESVSGRHVIVVEEIVDSGLTLARLLEDLRAGGPARGRCPCLCAPGGFSSRTASSWATASTLERSTATFPRSMNC
jgi:hypoxanthine phosphoribosyltransferase